MLRRRDSRTAWLCALVVGLWAGNGAAQNPELGDVGAQGQASGQYQGGVQAQGAWAAPPPPAATPVADPNAPAPVYGARFPDTDHALVVGRFGVGFFGIESVPVGGFDGANAIFEDEDGPLTVPAPTIGARYWLSETLGIEAALGLGISGGGTDIEAAGMTTELNGPSYFALAVHGAVPLVFAASRHFTFEVIPELNFGFASGGIDDATAANNDVDFSGMLLEIGGRVGAEIHFGFIDIPELALQASVGLHLRVESRTVTVGNVDTSNGGTRFGTTVQGEPWDIFGGNLTAIYYF